MKQCRMPVRTSAHGAEFLATRTTHIKVFKLNGKYGHPRLPGDWTIRSLCLSDQCRRGPMNRLRELNDWQEAALRRKYAGGAQQTIDQMASLDLRAALMRIKDELGVESHSREEHIAARAQLERDAMAAEEDIEAQIKSERLL